MFSKFCSVILFKVLGWKFKGELPDVPKYLYVVVPHTSNWDFVIGWLAIKALKLPVKVFAKDNFYVFPFNYVCDFLGVMPVNRRERTQFVDNVAALFEQQDQLALVITPEGTRSLQPGLKSGYYFIAQKANVPIVVASMDFKEKAFVLSSPRATKATFEEDEKAVIEFAKTIHARHPELSFR